MARQVPIEACVYVVYDQSMQTLIEVVEHTGISQGQGRVQVQYQLLSDIAAASPAVEE